MSPDGVENRVIKLETEMTQIRTDIYRLGVEAKERKNDCRETMRKIGEDIVKIRNNDLAHINTELTARRGFSRKEWTGIIVAIITSLASIAVAFIR